MHTLLRRIHLWLSIPAGLVIGIVCLSGAALVFEQEIVEATRPDLYFVEPAAERLAPSELVARIAAQRPELRIKSLQYESDPARACRVGFAGRSHTVLLADPYTGRLLGDSDEGKEFFDAMRRLHRFLMGGKVGKRIVGVSTLLLTVILLSGIALWIPRSRRSLRRRLTVCCTKGAHRFLYDLHVTAGAYVAPLLLVAALTGLTWSFGWYRDAFYALWGVDLRTLPARAPALPAEGIDYTAWDRALAQTERLYPDYRTITLLPGCADIATHVTGITRMADRAEFDPATGRIGAVTRCADQPFGGRLRSRVFALHVGRWGGWPAKLLTFVVAFVGGTLPFTGYYLWYRRLRARRAAAQKKG